MQPTYTHTHTHTHTHTLTHPHAHTYMQTHTHRCTHTRTCKHTYAYIHAHTHTCTHVHAHTRTLTHIHIHIHTHTHTHIPKTSNIYQNNTAILHSFSIFFRHNSYTRYPHTSSKCSISKYYRQPKNVIHVRIKQCLLVSSAVQKAISDFL